MTPEQLKKEVEKAKRENGGDTEVELEEVLDKWLDKDLVEEIKIKKSYLSEKNTNWEKVKEIEKVISQKKIKKMEYFWEKICKNVYPEFEKRLRKKIEREKED